MARGTVGCGGTQCLLEPAKQSVVQSAALEICAVSTRLSTKVPGWSGAIAIFPLRSKWEMLRSKGGQGQDSSLWSRAPSGWDFWVVSLASLSPELTECGECLLWPQGSWLMFSVKSRVLGLCRPVPFDAKKDTASNHQSAASLPRHVLTQPLFFPDARKTCFTPQGAPEDLLLYPQEKTVFVGGSGELP